MNLEPGFDRAPRNATPLAAAEALERLEKLSREQARAVRRLRRLATAAANLAGAATTEAVLQVACLEACVIHEADGAVARWWMPDASVVNAKAGLVDSELAESALGTASSSTISRGTGWLAYPLVPSDPWQRAVLMIFVSEDLSDDEQLVLSSLASLVPMAFERALGTEAALRHEARLRAVVDSSPVALVSLDSIGAVVMANRAAEALFGWSPGARREIPETLRAGLDDLAGQVARTRSVETRMLASEDFDLSVWAAPMPADGSASDEAVVVAATDLSEVRRAERVLVQAQRLEAMGQVAGRVAHDFNNILTLIVGYTSLMSKGGGPEIDARALANIDRAVTRAALLTQQMMGLGRKRAALVGSTDLVAELRDLGSVLDRLAGPGVRVSTWTPEDKSVFVRIDASELEQVVVNLVINACDAMGASGSLEVALEVDDERALLRVRDDGPGMSDEVRARCLEPFFTTKTRGHGTGLGLPTVSSLVADRGGHIEIDSAPGRGTEMRVWLPIASEAPEASPTASAAWPTGQLLSGGVVLVEDDPELRELAAATLRDTGLAVSSFASAEEALQLFGDEGRFDLLATDLVLPGMSGVDLARQLQRHRPGLPVLYMTGWSGNAGLRPRPDPGSEILHKPYAPDELRFKVAQLLGQAAC